MSIKKQLELDGTKALKSKDKVKLGVIRMVRSQIKNAEISKGSDLSNEDTIGILVSAVKARREALAFAREGGRDDLVGEAERDIDVLETYLPEALSEDEIRDIVSRAIADTGATGMKDMGRVMGSVMPHVKGKADGKQVNALVRDLLQELS